jgi:hypothetical protein
VVKCGKEKAESLVQANTTDPVWNFSAIFYRSRPEKDALKIQVEFASGTLYGLGLANYGRRQIRFITVSFYSKNRQYFYQCCGSGMFIPDPTFFHPRSRILIKEFKYFSPQKINKMVSKLLKI